LLFEASVAKRFIHSGRCSRSTDGGRHSKSSTTNEKENRKQDKQNAATGTEGTTSKEGIRSEATSSTAPVANKFLLDRLPHMPLHRPSKEELLAAATGFWSRLKVHFKWFSIRSVRPWNIDDISAFFSWLLVGHVIWIIVGTTTFFSLAIFMINTVVAQGALAF
jgi:distribution and morphology protein 31